MKKLARQICKYVCATLCVVALMFFAGLNIDNKNSKNGSSESALVSVNETTTKYVVAGGKVYVCQKASDIDAVSAENSLDNTPVANFMDEIDTNPQSISILNSNLEFVFLKDGVTDFSQTVQTLATTPVATQLSDEIASIVTATLTANSVEITIEDQKQTADVSTSIDAVYALNSLALSVNSSLEYNNGNFMVSASQASVSLLATTVFDQKSALVMKLESGSVSYKGTDSSNPVVYQPNPGTLGMGRAFYITGGNLTLGENVVLSGFSATDGNLMGGTSGGAIFVASSSSTLTLNCTITDCKVTGDGGAIWSNGKIIINGGNYSNNKSTNGDGGCIGSNGTITMSSGSISGNIAYGNGGAIYNSGTTNLNGGLITGNRVDDSDGGGILGYLVNINGATISENYARSTGGGVNASTVNFTKGTISNNSCTNGNGGGIYATTCTVASGATIEYNSAEYNGGGIYTETLKFTGGAVIANNKTVEESGGGIYISSDGSYTSSAEIIRNNYAGKYGGGICYCPSNALTLNCSLYDNEARSDGGGIEAWTASSISLTGGPQIYNNISGGNGGGIDCRCIIYYNGGSSSLGIFNNQCAESGQDIYLGSSSNYLYLNMGLVYSDEKTVSVYKEGLTKTNYDNIQISGIVVKSQSSSYASNFRKYLVVENLSSMSQCRVNPISSSESSTSLFVEEDICLLSFKSNNTWSDYTTGRNEYHDDNIFACYTETAKSFTGAVAVDNSRSWQFANNFTVNFWATMSSWAMCILDDEVMASSGGSKGWKFISGTDGVISCAVYDSGSSSYKYIELQTKYSDLSNNYQYMFTLTVTSDYYATLYLSQSGKIIDRSSVQLKGSVAYYYVVGPNTSSTVLGGLSGNGAGTIASGHEWSGTMQMFEIVNEAWPRRIVEKVCKEGTTNGSGVFKMGKGGDTYTLNSPQHPTTKSLGGWGTEQEFRGNLVDSTFTFASDSDGYLSRLSALWTTGTYTVIFDANGGTGDMASQTFNHNHTSSDGTYKLSKNTFTRTGYKFLGWGTSKYSSSANYKDEYVIPVGSKLTSNGTIRLYAVWSPNTICLTLSHEDADNAKKIGSEVYYNFDWRYISGYYTDTLMDDDYNVTSGLEALPVKAGYNFMGYYTGKSGSGKRWIKSDGTFVDGLYSTIYQNTTLYAYFKPQTITITLNNQGGSGITTLYCQYNINKFYNDLSFSVAFTKLSSRPTLNGYNFMGYYANPSSYTSSSAVQYIDANGNISSELCKATTEDKITIYANWKLKTYQVTVKIQLPDRDNGISFANTAAFQIYDGKSNFTVPSHIFTFEHGTTMSLSLSGNQLLFYKDGNLVGRAAPLIGSAPNGYTISFGTWKNADGAIQSDRKITAQFVATPISYTLTFMQITKSNTKLYDGRYENILSPLSTDKGTKWDYKLTYTIEDEIWLPLAEKDHYTVTGWQKKTSSGNWNGVNYGCGEYIEANTMYGDADFKLLTTANVYRVVFNCDQDNKGRATLITNSYSVLNKTIYIPYNGTLASDAYYVDTDDSTKVYLQWSNMPTVTGLVGWYKKSSYSGSPITVSTQFTTASNAYEFKYDDYGDGYFEVYAKWQPVTVVFHGKGALGQGYNPDHIPTSYGIKIVLADPTTETSTGWKFKGWYTEENGEGDRVGGIGETITVTATSTPLHLWAYWVGNEYEITWHGTTKSGNTDRLLASKYWNYAIGAYSKENNGNDNRLSHYTTPDFTATSSVVYGSSELGYCAPTPIRVGYTFGGWVDESGKQIIDSDDLMSFCAGTSDDANKYISESGFWNYVGNANLYASWIATNYSITVDKNGGSYSGTYPTTYSASNSKNISNPIRQGYSFVGWKVEASLKRQTQATINIDGGYLEYSTSYPIAAFYEPFYMETGVYYSANKRSANGSAAEIRWRGYKFDGTYSGSLSTSTSVKGEGKYAMLWYHNGNTNQTETLSYTISTTGAFDTSAHKATGDLKLTAQWSVNNYSISYNLDGGSISGTTVNSVSYNQTFSVPTPTKTGYLFIGWQISGMDGTTHSYGTASSLKETSYTSITTDDTATTFKNLRSTGGTVTFKAIWMVKNWIITITNANSKLKYFFAGSHYTISNTTKLYGRPEDDELKVPTSSSSDTPRYYSNGTFYDYANHSKVQVYVTGTGGLINSYTGHTFAGLYYGSTKLVDADGNLKQVSGITTKDSSGNVVWDYTSSTTTLSLTASWTTNTYNVIFDSASLSSAPTVSGLTKNNNYKYTAKYGDTFTVENPTKTGYEFAGWYITNSNSKKISTGSTATEFTSLSTMDGDEVTFKALWKTKYIKLAVSNASSLKFGNNLSADCLYVRYGGKFVYYIPTEYQNSTYFIDVVDSGQSENIYYTGSAYKSVPDDTITKVSSATYTGIGFTFDGLMSGESTQIFDSTLNAKTGSSSIILSAQASGTLSVSAKLVGKPYNIAYILNGGTMESSSPTSARYGTSFSVQNPTREGYDFAGWNITGMNSGATHFYKTTSTSWSSTTGTSISKTKATEFMNLHSNGGNITFTAVWMANEIKVTYNLYNDTDYADCLTLSHNSTLLDYPTTSNTITLKSGEKLVANATNVSAAVLSSNKWYGIAVRLGDSKVYSKDVRNDTNKIKNISLELTYSELYEKLSVTENSEISAALNIYTYYNAQNESVGDYMPAEGYETRVTATYNVGLTYYNNGTTTTPLKIYYDSTRTTLNDVSFSGNTFTYKDNNGTAQTITADNTYTDFTYSVQGITYKFSYWKNNANNSKVTGTIPITADASFTAVYEAYGKTINYECYYDYETCSDVYLVINGNEYRGKGYVYVTTDSTIELHASNIKSQNGQYGLWSSCYMNNGTAYSDGGYYYSSGNTGGTKNISANIDVLQLIENIIGNSIIVRSIGFRAISSSTGTSGYTTKGTILTTTLVDYSLYYPSKKVSKLESGTSTISLYICFKDSNNQNVEIKVAEVSETGAVVSSSFAFDNTVANLKVKIANYKEEAGTGTAVEELFDYIGLGDLELYETYEQSKDKYYENIDFDEIYYDIEFTLDAISANISGASTTLTLQLLWVRPIQGPMIFDKIVV